MHRIILEEVGTDDICTVCNLIDNDYQNSGLFKQRGEEMNYVMHFCRNKKCNNGWVDKDLTNVKTNPPKWKYCKECADKLGIDFDS